MGKLSGKSGSIRGFKQDSWSLADGRSGSGKLFFYEKNSDGRPVVCRCILPYRNTLGDLFYAIGTARKPKGDPIPVKSALRMKAEGKAISCMLHDQGLNFNDLSEEGQRVVLSSKTKDGILPEYVAN